MSAPVVSVTTSDERACQNSVLVSVCITFGQFFASRHRARIPSRFPVRGSVNTP